MLRCTVLYRICVLRPVLPQNVARDHHAARHRDGATISCISHLQTACFLTRLCGLAGMALRQAGIKKPPRGWPEVAVMG